MNVKLFLKQKLDEFAKKLDEVEKNIKKKKKILIKQIKNKYYGL